MADMDPKPRNPPDSLGLDAEDYDSSDSDTNNFDWKDPASFFKAIGAGRPGGLPFPIIKSAREVREEASKRASEIFTRYETLHQILQRHEPTIQKRWLKKTRQQRLKILLDTWPNMAVVHRPDFDALRKESMTEREIGTKYREWYMYPYINQEDLLNTKSLPLLLNSRGRHPPSHFAAADFEAMHIGVVSKAIVPSFLNGHVLMMNGMTENTHEYGHLLAWEDHPDASSWMHNQKQFMPGEGLLVLEAQERLLEFCIQCCQQILHDIQKSVLASDTFPLLPEPQLKTESQTDGFESLGLMAAEAPYRVPAQLDLGRIEVLLSARASAAEDHLWALREDPDYFLKALLEEKEHRLEMIKDLYGNVHPVCACRTQTILWARVIKSLLQDAYLGLEVFSELSNQAKGLIALHKRYTAEISPSRDLPEEYLVALLRLRYDLRHAAKGLFSVLEMAATASPPLRNFFAREPTSDPDNTRMLIVAKPGSEMNAVETHLIWLLQTLWDDGHQLFLARMSSVVDELGRLLQSDKHVQELISPYIARVVGDISIISQCLNQLDLYQPWARSFDYDLVSREAELKQDHVKRSKSWVPILEALQDGLPETRKSSAAVQLGIPSSGKFTYPFHKRRTKENIEILRKAESELDAFWAAVDRMMFAKAGHFGGTAVRNLLSQPRILQRTREWVEPEKPQSSASAQNKEGDVDPYILYKPISTIYSGLSARSLDVAQSKTKIKIRGTPQQTSTDSVAQPAPSDCQPTFHVDARALKVFRTVFFNPAVTSKPGEVPWNDFLHAMASVGFTVMKLYGSVWQFQPTSLDVERKIQFHEPHPRGKLPFTTARRYGRRLSHAYGWSGGMFVLDKK